MYDTFLELKITESEAAEPRLEPGKELMRFQEVHQLAIHHALDDFW